MNDHLAVLIYLTAARLRQQRLQAGTAGGLKFRPESHALMRREGRAEPGPICATTLYSSSVVSQSTPRAVTVSSFLTSCLLLSLPSAFTGSSCRWTGLGPQCRGLHREALARCRQIRRAWAVLHVHSAGLLGQRRLLAIPDFSENLVVFIPGNSGTENDLDSWAPGKREPWNPHPSWTSRGLELYFENDI